jgi:hypothetical protein
MFPAGHVTVAIARVIRRDHSIVVGERGDEFRNIWETSEPVQEQDGGADSLPASR